MSSPIVRRGVLALLVLGSAVAAWSRVGGPVGYVLGGTLILVLPGASLLALLDLRLRPSDSALIVLAASLAFTVFAGLVIGASHAGFDAHTWAAVIGGLCLVLCAGALARGATRPPASRPTASESGARLPLVHFGATSVMYAGAAVLALAAVLIARHSAIAHDRSVRLAQLWSEPGPEGTQAFHVQAEGDGTQRLRLVIEAPGKAPLTRSLVLDPGQREYVLRGVGARARARLWRPGAREVPLAEVGPARPEVKAAEGVSQ